MKLDTGAYCVPLEEEEPLDSLEISLILHDSDRMADPKEWDKNPGLCKRRLGELLPAKGATTLWVFKPTPKAYELAKYWKSKRGN